MILVEADGQVTDTSAWQCTGGQYGVLRYRARDLSEKQRSPSTVPRCAGKIHCGGELPGTASAALRTAGDPLMPLLGIFGVLQQQPRNRIPSGYIRTRISWGGTMGSCTSTSTVDIEYTAVYMNILLLQKNILTTVPTACKTASSPMAAAGPWPWARTA